MIKVLFVCMGNICRSPTAHGVFEHKANASGLAHAIEIDSAGTHAYHIGEPPDRRARQTAQRRGIRLEHLRARRVEISDFEYFDYILAMDEDNLSILQSLCPSHHQDKVRLFLEFATQRNETEVPDPYYGGDGGFDFVFDLVDDASEGLLEDIRKRHL
jgi:protein-tyrosine phosphatase